MTVSRNTLEHLARRFDVHPIAQVTDPATTLPVCAHATPISLAMDANSNRVSTTALHPTEFVPMGFANAKTISKDKIAVFLDVMEVVLDMDHAPRPVLVNASLDGHFLIALLDHVQAGALDTEFASMANACATKDGKVRHVMRNSAPLPVFRDLASTVDASVSKVGLEVIVRRRSAQTIAADMDSAIHPPVRADAKRDGSQRTAMNESVLWDASTVCVSMGPATANLGSVVSSAIRRIVQTSAAATETVSRDSAFANLDLAAMIVVEKFVQTTVAARDCVRLKPVPASASPISSGKRASSRNAPTTAADKANAPRLLDNVSATSSSRVTIVLFQSA